MKKTMALMALCALGVLFAGCPYESAVPIDQPGTKTDPRMLGKWIDEKERTTYEVTLKDGPGYRITQTKSDGTTEQYEAYPSAVNGSTFLNLYATRNTGTDKKFLLYKVLVTERQMTVWPVTEYVREKFTLSQELKAFVEANMKNSYFFESEGVLKKQ
jgi:hypothetical protein